MTWSGLGGAGGLTRRWTPTEHSTSSGASNASSLNPASARRDRTAGAGADDRNRPRVGVEPGSDVGLDDPEPPRQRRRLIGIRLVPGEPVLGPRHPSNVRRGCDTIPFALGGGAVLNGLQDGRELG